MTEHLHLFVIFCLVLISVVTTIVHLWPDVLPASPEAGERGTHRKRAIHRSEVFRKIEPLLRVLSRVASRLPLSTVRINAEALAKKAGYPLGIDGNDLLAISIVSAVSFGVVFGMLVSEIGRPVQVGLLVGAIFGTVAPWFKLQDAAKHRCLSICRGLPGVVDLISLSMESGLDFMNAMRQTADRLHPDNPLRFELEHMLHKMSLGRARSEVLQSLADRIPAPTIQQFTTAVIQAEKRGTPLAEVLAVQAKVQRTKRSQAAEQAAARAAVYLIGPLMLIFACVFIVIMGPFAIKFARGDLF